MSDDDQTRTGHRGAVLVFVGFLVLAVGMWSWTYFVLIDRG